MRSEVEIFIILFITGNLFAHFFTNSHLYLPLIIFTIITFLISLFFYRKILTKITPTADKKRFIAITYLLFLLLGICNYSFRSDRPDSFQKEFFSDIKEHIHRHIEEIIDKPEDNAVLRALVTGDKSLIPRDLKNSYKNAGTMHVLALSGMHIGIIYTLLSKILFLIGTNYKKKYIKFTITVTILLSYAAMTGLSPSVLRATIMIILYNISTLTCRHSRKLLVLLLSALIIIVLDPKELFNIGFQLSFSAMIGIMYIFPIIKEHYKLLFKNKFIDILFDITAISVSCQIATLPISYYYFKNLPDYYLLANLATLPIISAIMYTFPLSVIFMKVPVIGMIIRYILNYLLDILNIVTVFFSQ